MLQKLLQKLNEWLDVLSEYFAHRKGLLPLIGLALIVINGFLQLFPILGWLVTANCFLHVGLIVVIIGFLLAWAL